MSSQPHPTGTNLIHLCQFEGCQNIAVARVRRGSLTPNIYACHKDRAAFHAMNNDQAIQCSLNSQPRRHYFAANVMVRYPPEGFK